jgi:farnesyl diphosphate synthase
MSQQFRVWMQQKQDQCERALADFIPQASVVPGHLHEAMRYAALDGGKRVRPLLVYAAGQLFDAPQEALDRAAAAVEMIHAYSLVHDDMPCMDDDALRRGKPTVHVKYDEATALLVGDALQAQAFLVLPKEIPVQKPDSDWCACLPMLPARSACVVVRPLISPALVWR